MNHAEFLLARLQSLGVAELFGIPGDYILPFFESLEASPIRHVATCNELNAGYAADGYARLRGAGAVAVTYGPGSFSLVNAVAAAYAERSPLVVISGGPPLGAYEDRRLLHHVLPGRLEASLEIFRPITVDARVLLDPATAARDIDAALRQCLLHSRPVYLEVPQDLQHRPCAAMPDWQPVTRSTDPAGAADAVRALAERLRASRHCVWLVGHEVVALGQQQALRELVDRTGAPVATVFAGRPDFIEDHPRCIGLYHGLGSLEPVREFVESADTVVWLGAVASDFNKGGSTAKLTPAQEVRLFDDQLWIDGRVLEPAPLSAVLPGLAAELPAGQWADLPLPDSPGYAHRRDAGYRAEPDAPITNQRFYDRIASWLQPGDLVLADAGPCISMAYVQLPPGGRYLASGYWASIGAGVGMALGAAFARDGAGRVIGFEGDGAFQMTAQELSTMVRYDRRALIFLINNRGYTAERLIHDGSFNDIQNWDYWHLPEVFGGVPGCLVRSEGELEAALARAGEHAGPGPLLIEISIDPFDVPAAFERMSAGLRHR